jgi:hypothetical protein
MQSERYPKLGTTNSLYPRNQFGRPARRHTTLLCAACDREAMHSVTVRKSWFRNEDDRLMLCNGHKTMAVNGEWERLYSDIKAAAARA